MSGKLTIAVAALSVLALNLPFGYWRAGTRKLSATWFAAIHLPVPMAIGVRWILALPFSWKTIPIFVLAFFTGQLLGGRWRHARGRAVR